MRHIARAAGLLGSVAAVTVLLGPVQAKGTKPSSMSASACRVDDTQVRVSVTWSNLYVTGGEFMVNIAPLETGYSHAWNWPGRPTKGTYTIDMNIGTDIADLVTVNLYNARNNPITFEQRVLGVGNEVEELSPCP